MLRFITKADVMVYLSMFFEDVTNIEQQVMRNAHMPEFYTSEGLFPRVRDAQSEFLVHKMCRPNTTQCDTELPPLSVEDFSCIDNVFNQDYKPDPFYITTIFYANNPIPALKDGVNTNFIRKAEQTAFMRKFQLLTGEDCEKLADMYFESRYFVYAHIKHNRKDLLEKFKQEFNCARLMFFIGIAKLILIYLLEREIEFNNRSRSEEDIGLQDMNINNAIQAVDRLLPYFEEIEVHGRKITVSKETITGLIEWRAELDVLLRGISTPIKNARYKTRNALIVRGAYALSHGFVSPRYKNLVVCIMSKVLVAIGLSCAESDIKERYDKYAKFFHSDDFIESKFTTRSLMTYFNEP